tara:strand:+ start:209 stop:595 length:387 start_codon:yes stop_codon:yes gene_type:complete
MRKLIYLLLLLPFFGLGQAEEIVTYKTSTQFGLANQKNKFIIDNGVLSVIALDVEKKTAKLNKKIGISDTLTYPYMLVKVENEFSEKDYWYEFQNSEIQIKVMPSHPSVSIKMRDSFTGEIVAIQTYY